jgi:hypothetical protein
LAIRVTAIETQLATPHTNGGDSLLGLVALGVSILALVAVPVGLFAWLEPHLETDLKKDVSIEVTAQLKEPLSQLSQISTDIADIKGQLKILAPVISERLTKNFKNSKSLPISQIKNSAEVALSSGLKIDSKDLTEVGRETMARLGEPDAWDATLALLSYKTFLNSSSLQVLPTPKEKLYTRYETPTLPGYSVPRFQVAGIAPKAQAAMFILHGNDLNADKSQGNQFIFATGGAVPLDGLKLRNVVFQGVAIYYSGGDLSMENVYFINCRFYLPKAQNSTRLAFALLQPETAVSFNAS